MKHLTTGLAALIALSVLSVFVGVAELTAGAQAWELIIISRAPRLFAILITGAALAVCGTILQMLVRNRFVEPMTVGTGQGAAFGILLVTFFAPAAPLIVKMAGASATALLSSLGFLIIARKLPTTEPLLVALVGLIYGGIIGAGVIFVAFQADLLQYIEIWMNGEFSGVLQGRYELLWLAAAAALISYLAADQFAIVGMGRTATINLGLNYRQVMVFGLVVVSIVSALTVVIVGMIPFVGLLVPNVVSRIYGDNLRKTLPLIACFGAGLVLIADILGRLIRYPFEIPVGTVLGVIGAVLFLLLLYCPVQHAR